MSLGKFIVILQLPGYVCQPFHIPADALSDGKKNDFRSPVCVVVAIERFFSHSDEDTWQSEKNGLVFLLFLCFLSPNRVYISLFYWLS